MHAAIARQTLRLGSDGLAARWRSLLGTALLALAGALLPMGGNLRAQGPASLPTHADPVGPMSVTDLRCEFATNPTGIDVAQPRLFWRLEGTQRGTRQTSYQIVVASRADLLLRDQADLWDSEKVASAVTTFVRYAGKPLSSSQTVYWKVRTWNAIDQASAWSAPQQWTMGLLKPADWKGTWIAAPSTSETVLLRRDFTIRPGLRRAVVHVCGLGQYELSLNGRKVGDDLLTPGWTNFDEVTLYDTYDVTAWLREGANAAGLNLGNGMYNVVRRQRFSKFTGSFGPLRAVLHLRLEYGDGTVEFVGTDEQWRSHSGPITFSSIYGGEDYDARLEPVGWNQPGFTDQTWTLAVAVNRPADTLRGHTFGSEPIRVIEARPAVKLRELKPGVVLYDFGQNALFMPRLKVSGPIGSTVRMTPGEVVNEDGTIDRGTMGGAHRGSAWWQYTKATDGEETWFPKFYLVGSRYLYVELIPAGPVAPTALSIDPDAITSGIRPKIESLEQVIVRANVETVGSFETSNELLNRIRDLVLGAQRSNIVSILMDCPHREKLGWLEQTHLNGPALRYNFDLSRLYAKISGDMARAQLESGMVPNIAPEYTTFKGAFRSAAEWGAAFIIVPWQQYQFTGDVDLLHERYPAMQRYLAYLESRTDHGVLRDGLGDWNDIDIAKGSRAGLTPPALTATAFYYQDTAVLSQIAAVLGHEADAKRYAAAAATIRETFNREFFHGNGTPLYGTGSQTSFALPLAFGLVEAGQRPAVLGALVSDIEQRGYATAGAAGIRYVFEALADADRSDVVLGFVRQDEKPGYAFQLKQGATTLTETWNASRSASWNHFFLGQVMEWYYRDLAGISGAAQAPGFARVIIRPQPVGDLAWVQASYKSIHGPFATRWEHSGSRFTLKASVPPNTTATVFVPSRSGTSVMESGRAAENSEGVVFLRREGDRTVYGVQSGTYEFSSTW